MNKKILPINKRMINAKLVHLSISLLITLFVYFFIGLLHPPVAHGATLQHIADFLSTPQPATTAMHTFTFSNPTTIPSNGKIVFTFNTLSAGDSNNPATASASTFQLNSLSNGSVQLFSGNSIIPFSGTYTNPSGAGTHPVVALGLLGTSIPSGSTITVILGCSGASNASCTSPLPTIINPTKSATTSADTWTIRIQTKDASSNDIDEGKTKIATLPGINVSATVIPQFTFTISGIPDGSIINSINPLCAGNTDTTNSGTNSTATDVDLGKLSPTAINLSAQTMKVTTSANTGYAVTASSPTHLTNTDNGFLFPDSTSPTTMTAGTLWYGIHACGDGIDTTIWGNGKTGSGTGNKYAWPFQIASFLISTKPKPANSATFSVEYGVTADGNTPGGSYTTSITYTAVPTF